MTNFKHSTAHGRTQAKSALRHLTEKGKEFINEHPFFGMEENLPKTVAKIHELAEMISAGAIDHEAAEVIVEQTLEDECGTYIEDSDGKVANAAFNAMFANLATA